MTQTKHTPAPWIVEKVKTSSGHCFCIGAKEQIEQKRQDRLKIPSYACLYVDYNNAHLQAEANAHLIAAAPELLEALEDCLDALENHSGDDAWGNAVDARCKAGKAIAKDCLVSAK